jgi:ankyrin repeat protein
VAKSTKTGKTAAGKSKAQEAAAEAFSRRDAAAEQHPYLCEVISDKRINTDALACHYISHYLAQGCNPNQPDAKGEKPIDLAMKRHFIQAALLLKTAGATPPAFDGNKEGDPNQPLEYRPQGTWYTNDADEMSVHTPLTYYAKKMYPFEYFIKAIVAGADINKKNSQEESPLQITQEYRDGAEWPWLATQLVKLGAWCDPDKPDPNEVVNQRTGATRLLAVILEGKDYPAVERIIKEGADVNKPDHSGLTPLAAALAVNWLPVEQLLIKHGAREDVTLPDPDVLVGSRYSGKKKPLLTYAMRVSNMHENFFLSLLDAGANPDIRDENGATPAFTACVHNELWHLKHLYDAGADLTICDNSGYSPLANACYNNHLELVKWMDGRVPDTEFTKHMGKGQETPLHLATNRENSTELVAFLLSKGADPNAPNARGETPIQVAAQRKGNAEALKLMMTAGASNAESLNAKDQNGYTALDAAISGSTLDPQTVRYLLDQGADVKQMSPGSDKCNPALFEMLHSNWSDSDNKRAKAILEILEMLVAAGPIDFNIKGTKKNWNSDLDTTLVYGASQSINAKLETVDFLLAHGADVYGTSPQGETIAHQYVSRHNVKGLKLLLDRGFDPLKHWKFSTNWSNGPHAHDGTILDEVRMLYLSDKHYKREKETQPMLDLVEGHLRAKGIDPDKIPYPVMLAPTYYEHQEALGKKWREEEEKKNPKKKDPGFEP